MPISGFSSVGTIGASLLPKRYDVDIYQGDTFLLTLVFKDSNNVVIDITGWTVLCQFRSVPANAIVATPTSTIDGPNGTVTLKIADTLTLTEGTYIYDVQLTDTGGNKRTYIGGNVVVTGDVSE